MALGDKTNTISGESFVIELLASVTATNGAPSANSGIETNLLRTAGKLPDKIRVGIESTAGSGTMSVAARVWLKAGGKWFIAKSLAADPATPQTAGTIAETSSDSISYSEEVSGISGADRIYLEISTIAGTSTAVTGYAIVGP